MFQEELQDILGEIGGFEAVTVASNTQEALAALRTEPAPSLVLLDIYLPAAPSARTPTVQGPRIAKEVRKLLPEVRLVIISSLDRDKASALIRGEIADDFVTKESTAQEIEARIAHQARAARRLAADLSRSGVHAGGGIQELVGNSAIMNQVRDWICRASLSHAPVLITGESGCGKELAAWTLHRRSPWARGPFLPFNAAAVGEGLLEAELFGHQKGAFTGASESRAGVVEAATGGTLFLDEIGELPLNFQVKLLRFLDTGTYHRLGEDRPRQARVRLVFATNRDLPQEVLAGTFRKDLLYRLDVLHLRLPPLRTRREDLPELARFLIHLLASSQGVPPPKLGPEVIELLKGHAWPGNVRELRNVLERAMILSPGGQLNPEAIARSLSPSLPPYSQETTTPSSIVPSTTKSPPSLFVPGRSLKETMEGQEKAFLQEALEFHQGNVTATAKAVGIARRTLQEKMVRHQLRGQ
jgi:DNA-binding NtrC family response regulator